MNRLFLGLGVAAVAVIVAVGAFIINRGNSAPDEFQLTDVSEAATDNDSPADDPAEGDAPAAEDQADNSASAAEPLTDIDGTWTVAEGSEAGYRVVEDINGIIDFEAVGRTPDVDGTIEITGTTVTAGEFSVLVGSISSDDRRRDNQFANNIMRTRDFPTATLVLNEPIELGSLPEPGSTVSTTAQGALTLRDVTNDAPINVAAQVLGDQIEIVASVDVLFSDFGIDNPTNAFVTVRDEGKVEVRLLLSRT